MKYLGRHPEAPQWHVVETGLGWPSKVCIGHRSNDLYSWEKYTDEEYVIIAPVKGLRAFGIVNKNHEGSYHTDISLSQEVIDEIIRTAWPMVMEP